MFVSTTNPVGEYISPFGSRIHIPAGDVTTVSVESGYWLVRQPEVTVKFESDAEEARCAELNHLSALNPLRTLPQPQHLTPNATLQMEGGAVQYPVIVVNPVGLFAEHQSTYDFNVQPQVSIIPDKALLEQIVRNVLAEVQAALNAPYEPDEEVHPVEPEVEPETAPEVEPETAPEVEPETVPEVEPEVETVDDLDVLTEDELDALTNPEESEPAGAAPLEVPDSEEPSEPPADTEATQESTGRGRRKHKPISLDDV